MNVYFDIPNLRSYAKSGGHPCFMPCTDMIRKGFNIHFCFDKSLLAKEKKQSQQSIMTVLKLLTRNRGNSEFLTWNEVFPPRPLDAELYSTMTNEQLTSLYFLDDDNIKTMEQHGCLLFASEGNEIKALSRLLIEQQDLPTKKYAIRNMSNWNVIEDNTTPCTDIIIVDPYLFAQSDILYEYNSYKLIEHLSKINTLEVNVVIFTSITKDSTFSTTTIDRQLKSKMGKKLNLTFVYIPEGKLKEHDRTIITNYKMFDSGPSFTYFNDKGENQSHGRWLNVNSLGDKEIRILTLQYIKDLQSLIDDRKSGLNSIVGDKKSTFLSFF